MCCFSAFCGIPNVTQLCRPFLGGEVPSLLRLAGSFPLSSGTGRWSLCLDLKTLDYHTGPNLTGVGPGAPQLPQGDPCALWACLVPVSQGYSIPAAL